MKLKLQKGNLNMKNLWQLTTRNRWNFFEELLCSDAVTFCIFTFLIYFYLIQDNTDDEEEESEKSKTNANDDDEEETGEVMFIGFDSLYTIHNLPFIACVVVFVLSAVRFG